MQGKVVGWRRRTPPIPYLTLCKPAARLAAELFFFEIETNKIISNQAKQFELAPPVAAQVHRSVSRTFFLFLTLWSQGLPRSDLWSSEVGV
jgi:hypothetical protein